MNGSWPAKKAKRRDYSKGIKVKKAKKPVTILSKPFCTQQQIRNILFSYSQRLLFHPRIYKLIEWAFPCLVKSKNVPTSVSNYWSYDHIIMIKRHLPPLFKIKFLFKIFLHRWRSRRLKIINQEDVATMSIPKKPVYIVHWPTASAHIFEAATLMRDITERLQTHDGAFDTPMPPRNPFTNSPLTQAQCISVWNQIYGSGIYVGSAFTCFRQSGWNLPRYCLEYLHPIKLHALRKTMSDPHHEDYIERMLDFIEYVYEKYDVDCETWTYKRMLALCPKNRLLKKWAVLCKKFYEASILYPEDSAELGFVHGTLIASASVLIGRVSQGSE
jgi:hypothetical protein